MNFEKIKVNDAGVEFEWTSKEGDVTHTHRVASDERPAPELPNALNAFRDYVVEVLGLPDSWTDKLVVTSIAISGEEGERGINVCALRKIERARSMPLVLNVPIMKQRTDGATSEIGFFGDEVLALIEEAELRAEDYVVRGERLDPSLFTSEQIAAMERDKGGKKKKRPAGKKLGDGQFVEASPVAGEPLTDELLRTLIASAGYDVPVDAISSWTQSERDDARKFAEQAQKDLAEGGRVSRVPEIIQRCATPPLITDDLSRGKAEPRKRLQHHKKDDDGRGRPKGKR